MHCERNTNRIDGMEADMMPLFYSLGQLLIIFLVSVATSK
jgi:hypothetical protein